MTYQEKYDVSDDEEILFLEIEWKITRDRHKKTSYEETFLFATESVSSPGEYDSTVCMLNV